MDWIRRGAVDACSRQARHLVSVILATAGVIVLATACVACGQTTPSASGQAANPSPEIVTSNAGDSSVAAAGPHGVNASAGGSSGSGSSPGGSSGSGSSPGGSSGSGSSAGGGSGSGCPTQGIGGDSVAPLCVTPATSSSSGIQGPVTAPPTNTPTQQSPPTKSPTQPVPAAAAPPQVTGISPASGGTAGGDSVTITGSGFTGATAVKFGGVTAQMTVDSGTEITAINPPGSGTVDVTVVTPDGTSATSAADQFTYQG
jgi:IPT/TIG domain